MGQINTAMSQLNQTTQQNSSASEELAATAEEMSSQAEQLQQTMSFFRTGGAAQQAVRRKEAAKIKPKIASSLSAAGSRLSAGMAEPVLAEGEFVKF